MDKKHYDCIVVGSGITGLTAARILAQHGKRVLMLEKASILGGSLARFRVGGMPFDVGFHFTGGFNREGTGVLDVMLGLLGVRERIRPIYFPSEACHRMVFPKEGAAYVVPSGMEVMREKMRKDFPVMREGLDRYFARFMKVIEGTPTLAVSGFLDYPPALEEDGVTLQSVMDECVPDRMVQTILGGLCLCYGTRPNEASFSTHCRVSFGLQESLARVEDGGDAFVDALVEVLKNERVEIRTRCTIGELADIQEKRVLRFVLSDGTEVSAGGCVFTQHPQSILSVLPKEHLSKAFQNRVGDFAASPGFFTVYGAMEEGTEEVGGGPATLASIMPDMDLNEMLTCRSKEAVDGAMMVLRSREKGASGAVNTMTALEVAFGETTMGWEKTTLKRRPAEYYAYKAERTASIMGRIGKYLPECRGVRVIDSASVLTYRDYLHSPDGSAYGIRQKMGQFNLSGRLPIRNLYAAGQSALLPGVLGAMTSAFFVCRGILGMEVFREYLMGKACSNAS